jgi:hypothetical protein
MGPPLQDRACGEPWAFLLPVNLASSLGEAPMTCLKEREKWRGSSNPSSPATSCTCMPFNRSSSAAWFILRRSRYR